MRDIINFEAIHAFKEEFPCLHILSPHQNIKSILTDSRSKESYQNENRGTQNLSQ